MDSSLAHHLPHFLPGHNHHCPHWHCDKTQMWRNIKCMNNMDIDHFSIFSLIDHIWAPKHGFHYLGWNFFQNSSRFLWGFFICHEGQPVSNIFRSTIFSVMKTFLVNCNMSFHDEALHLVVKGFQRLLESVSRSCRNSLKSPLLALIFGFLSFQCLLGQYCSLPSQRPGASPMLTSLKSKISGKEGVW